MKTHCARFDLKKTDFFLTKIKIDFLKRRVKTLTKKYENLNNRIILNIYLFNINYIEFDNNNFFIKTTLNYLNQKFENL